MNTNLMVARKRRGLTQKQLAAKVRVNATSIVLIERYGWLPPIELRQRLAAALKADEHTLFSTAAS